MWACRSSPSSTPCGLSTSGNRPAGPYLHASVQSGVLYSNSYSDSHRYSHSHGNSAPAWGGASREKLFHIKETKPCLPIAEDRASFGTGQTGDGGRTMSAPTMSFPVGGAHCAPRVQAGFRFPPLRCWASWPWASSAPCRCPGRRSPDPRPTPPSR